MGSDEAILVAVVGAHLDGQPLNGQLTERGGYLVKACSTAPEYRLYALKDTVPPKPGLQRVLDGSGYAIEVEVWALPAKSFGSFMKLISSPLGIGTLRLDDGTEVKGFICEPFALATAHDISRFGGWRNYLAAGRESPGPH
jgi:allophanate hydrolase